MVIIIRIQEGKEGLGMLENMQFEWEIFTLNPVVYTTVDFKEVVSDEFQADSNLVESECMKRKTRLSE